MNWADAQERHAFAEQTAAVALHAMERRAILESAVRSAVNTESPIEAIFAAWFTIARSSLLAQGQARFALEARPQAWVECEDQRYRLDFALEPLDTWLAGALVGVGLELRVGVELDGHDYHERTRAQVIARNQRDRDLSSLRWRVLHYSGSELTRNPMIAVVDVLVAGADALDLAKAALLHG